MTGVFLLPPSFLLGGDLTVFIEFFQRYQVAVSLHKLLVLLDEFETPSKNELKLTYPLPKSRKATIASVFLPNTRHIAEAPLVDSDIDIDIQELVHSACNDAAELLRAILARLRADVQCCCNIMGTAASKASLTQASERDDW